MTAMAALGLSAGFWIRNRLRGRPDQKEPGGGARVDEAESLMIPWQNPGREEDCAFETPQGRERILQMHEIRTAEGVRRVLEGILPASGADRVLFVTRSEDPGRPFLVRHEVRKSGGDSGAASFIPDSYVPLREAMVFRRTFFSEGEEAERWGLSCGGGMERASGGAPALRVRGRGWGGAGGPAPGDGRLPDRAGGGGRPEPVSKRPDARRLGRISPVLQSRGRTGGTERGRGTGRGLAPGGTLQGDGRSGPGGAPG